MHQGNTINGLDSTGIVPEESMHERRTMVVAFPGQRRPSDPAATITGWLSLGQNSKAIVHSNPFEQANRNYAKRRTSGQDATSIFPQPSFRWNGVADVLDRNHVDSIETGRSKARDDEDKENYALLGEDDLEFMDVQREDQDQMIQDPTNPAPAPRVSLVEQVGAHSNKFNSRPIPCYSMEFDTVQQRLRPEPVMKFPSAFH
ncbi:hypothetical protein M422DRAFT_248906 [Sphaerobolus stellatus SS14]|nr:hypothetical protein M422DRAFT_248906 [Sphaerobolus stellatus SS14]